MKLMLHTFKTFVLWQTRVAFPTCTFKLNFLLTYVRLRLTVKCVGFACVWSRIVPSYPKGCWVLFKSQFHWTAQADKLMIFYLQSLHHMKRVYACRMYPLSILFLLLWPIPLNENSKTTAGKRFIDELNIDL